MKIQRLFLFLVLIFTCRGLAGEEVSPWDLWRQGYTAYEKGESARDRGDHVQALEYFTKAVESYRAVQRARPSWNQNVINSRIMLCEQEIADARRLLKKPAPVGTAPSSISGNAGYAAPSGTLSGTPLPSATPGATAPAAAESYAASAERDAVRAELVKAQAEAAQYKQKLFASLVEIEDLRRQSVRGRTAAQEMENMLRERRVQNEKYRLLENRCKMLESSLAKPNTQLQEANRKILEMRINLETAERKLELARNREQEQQRENADLLQRLKQQKDQRLQAEQRRDTAAAEAEDLRNIRSQAAQEKNALLLKLSGREKQLDAVAMQLRARNTEVETLNRRLQEAIKSKGDSTALSTEITAENEKLRKETADAVKTAETNAAEARNLQSQLREQHRVVADMQTSIRRQDDRRLQLENELKVMREQVEKTEAAQKLAYDENSKLRRRNRKLEEDVKNLMDQQARYVKRLESRDSADRAAVDALGAERTRLSDQVSALKLKAAESKVESEALRKRLEDLSQAAAEQRSELLKVKTQLMAARQENQKSAAAADQNRKLAEELETMKRNSTALQIERNDLLKIKEKLADLQPELERLRKTASAMDALQREEQAMSDQNAQLRRRTEAAEAAAKQLRRQRDEALAGIVKAQQERDAAESAAVVLRRRETESETRRKIDQKKRAEIEVRLAEASRLLNQQEKHVSEVEHRAAASLKQSEELQRQLDDLQKKLKSSSEQLRALEQNKLQQQTAVNTLTTRLAESEKQLKTAQDRYTETDKTSTGLRQQLADVQSRLEQTSRQLAKEEKNSFERQKTIEKLRLTLEDNQRRQATLSRQAGQSVQAAKAEQERLARLQEEAELRAEQERMARLREKAAAEAKAEQERLARVAAEAKAEKDRLMQLRAKAEAEAKAERERLARVAAEAKAEKDRLIQARAKAEAEARAEKERMARLRETAAAEAKAEQERLARMRERTEAEQERIRLKRLQAETEAEKLRLSRLQAETEAEKLRLKRQKEAAEAANLELRKQMDAAVAAAQAAARTVAVPAAAGENIPVITPENEKLAPKVIQQMLAKAAAAEKQDAPKIARWNYRKILESDPTNFEANFGMGRLELAQEEFTSAAIYLQQAYIARENRNDVRTAYAKALLGQKKYGNALAILDKCPDPARKDLDYLYARGIALSGSGHMDQARQYLLQAHHLAPKRGDILLALAKLPPANKTKEAQMQSAKWYEDAKKLGATPDPILEKSLGKLINERVELIDFMSGAALEAERHRDWNSAVWYYGQLRNMDPGSGFYAERAARYCFLQKKYQETLKMLSDRPATASGEWLRAAALLGNGKTAEAETAAQKAAAMGAKAPDADLEKILNTFDRRKSGKVLQLLKGK